MFFRKIILKKLTKRVKGCFSFFSTAAPLEVDAARWFSSGYEPHINTAAFEGEEAEAEAEYGLKERLKDEEEKVEHSLSRDKLLVIPRSGVSHRLHDINASKIQLRAGSLPL